MGKIQISESKNCLIFALGTLAYSMIKQTNKGPNHILMQYSLVTFYSIFNCRFQDKSHLITPLGGTESDNI